MDPDFHRRDLADAIESRRLPAVGARACRSSRTPPEEMFDGIDLLDPTKLVPEELAPVQPDRPAHADRTTRRTSSPRPSRSPSTSATSCPASTSPTTRCCRRGSSRTSTPSSPGSADRTSPRSRSTVRTRRSTTCCATASTSTPCTAASRRTSRTRSTAAARSSPAAPGRRVHRRAGTRRGVGQDARGAGVLRRPLQPGPPVLAEHDAPSRRSTSSRPTPSSWRSASSRRSRSASCWRSPTSTRTCARRSPTGLGLPAPEPTVPLVDLDPSPALSQLGDTWPTDGRIIGIVVDPDGDLNGVATVAGRRAGGRHGPARHRAAGGKLPGRHRRAAHLRRRRAPSSSTRLLVAGSPAPAADALVVRDSKAGADGEPGSIPAWSCCSRSASATPRRSVHGVPAWTRWRSPGWPGRLVWSRSATRSEAFADVQELAGRSPGVGAVRPHPPRTMTDRESSPSRCAR